MTDFEWFMVSLKTPAQQVCEISPCLQGVNSNNWAKEEANICQASRYSTRVSELPPDEEWLQVKTCGAVVKQKHRTLNWYTS